MEIRMKKYLTIIIIAVLLVLPTVFAIKSYVDEKNAPPTDKSVVEMVLVDLNGKTHIFKQSDTTEEFKTLTKQFLNAGNNSTKIAALPENVADQTPFRVTFRTAVKEETRQFYLSDNASLCYMLDSDGTVYHLAEDSIRDFLLTKYAESLYESAARPILTLAGEYEVAPSESRWEYKANSSEFITADTSSVITNAVQNFTTTGVFSLEFNIIPDLCHVKVTDNNGNELFNDTLDKFGTLTVEEKTDVTVDVSASWYEETSRDYKGENKYSFHTTLNAPAAFFAVKTQLKNGDFIAFTAKNALDPSKIKFKCEPTINFTPTFYSEGGDSPYAHGLFAVPIDTLPGEYTVTLSYGTTTQQIGIKVLDRGTITSTKDITVSADVLSKALSEEALKEYGELVKTLTSNPTDKRLFDGSFTYFPNAGFSYHIGYSKPTTVNGNQATKEVSTRVCYSAAAGTAVPAQNNGKVVYSGSLAYTGNTVVIDHGLGLMTWYYGMDSCTVSVGDEVKKGDKIGVVGNTGVMETNVTGVHAAMSVGDTFVSFYPLCTEAEDSGDGGIYMYGVLEPPKDENAK